MGKSLANRRVGLVYGGGNVGLMGAVADAVLKEGGEVIGVIPEALVDRELAHRAVSELIVVRSMHERKAKMAALSDDSLPCRRLWHIRRILRDHYLGTVGFAPQTVRPFERRRILRPAADFV